MKISEARRRVDALSEEIYDIQDDLSVIVNSGKAESAVQKTLTRFSELVTERRTLLGAIERTMISNVVNVAKSGTHADVEAGTAEEITLPISEVLRLAEDNEEAAELYRRPLRCRSDNRNEEVSDLLIENRRKATDRAQYLREWLAQIEEGTDLSE